MVIVLDQIFFLCTAQLRRYFSPLLEEEMSEEASPFLDVLLTPENPDNPEEPSAGHRFVYSALITMDYCYGGRKRRETTRLWW